MILFYIYNTGSHNIRGIQFLELWSDNNQQLLDKASELALFDNNNNIAMLSSLPSLKTIDPEAAALRGLISAIAINCINQNHTSHNDIQSIITQYTERYPTLTVALIEGEIVSQQRPPLNEGGVSAPSKLPAAGSGLVGGASIAEDQETVYHHATTANSEQPEHEPLFVQSIAATTTNTTTTTTTTTHINRKRKSPSTKVTTTNGNSTRQSVASVT